MAWRDTGRRAKFFFVDAMSAFPLVLFLLHIRWWTFFLAIASMLVFWLVERKGFFVPECLRWLRNKISGPRKLGVARRLQNKLYD